MFRLFHVKEKAQLEIIKDLQGKPYKFYRGKNYDYISQGCFFCSCFDIAKSYRLHDETPIIETEIAVRKPLVIDATTKDGHSAYGYLYVKECKLYPEEKRGDLVDYITKVGGRDTLSTDEVLEWARGTKDIDAVIIKNVREGINNALPMYDVMIWDVRNLVNARNVVNTEHEFETFRENTFKRVDLSAYISEEERDGVVNIVEGNDHFVENTIQRGNIKWYMRHELVVNTNVPIEIYCLDDCKYVTADQLEPGIYKNTFGMTLIKTFVPHNGSVRVNDIVPNWKYRIECKKTNK